MKIIDQYLSGDIDAENALIAIKLEQKLLDEAFEEISKSYMEVPVNRSGKIKIVQKSTYNYYDNQRWSEIAEKSKKELKTLEQTLKIATDKGGYIDPETGEYFEPVTKRITQYLQINIK